MDHKHRLDAPHNDSLNDIEQVSDHSELSSLYFQGRKEWEGKDLLSDEQRSAKRDAELQGLRLSARRRFALLGLLLPTPIIALTFLIGWAVAFLNADNIMTMLPVAVLAIFLWLALSYTTTRKTLSIFYDHTISAAPFLIVSLTLIGLSTQEVILLTRPLHTDVFLQNALIVSLGVYVASIILTGILLLIWVSPRLSGRLKMTLVGVLAFILITSVFVTVLQ